MGACLKYMLFSISSSGSFNEKLSLAAVAAVGAMGKGN
jgi:hypothetical protein